MPGHKPKHEYYVIHALGWPLQLTSITLTFDVKSESVYFGKTCIKCNIETVCCPQNQAIKATVIWEPNDHRQVFDVGGSNSLMIKFPKTLLS